MVETVSAGKQFWTPKRRKRYPNGYKQFKQRSQRAKRGWKTRRKHHDKKAKGINLCRLADRKKLADKITDDFNTGNRLDGITREQAQRVKIFFTTTDDAIVRRFDIVQFKRFLTHHNYIGAWQRNRLCRHHKGIIMASMDERGDKDQEIYRYTRRVKQ